MTTSKAADAERLKRLYTERVPAGMSQEDFGATYGIGNQSMVSQYLSGHRPLNYEAAARFAKGLRCTIRDISPEMANALEEQILPMLGAKALKRAMLKLALVAMGIFTIPPMPAQAATGFNISLTQYTLALMRRLRARLAWPS